MESNWRFNVWLSGHSYELWELLARVHVPGTANSAVLKRSDLPGIPLRVAWTPGSMAAVVGVWPVIPGHPHFPYGYEVDPD